MIAKFVSKLLPYIDLVYFKFLDTIYFFYCAFVNIIKYKKLYEKKITYITGADDQFYNQSRNLILNINKYDASQKIIFYNLGLQKEQIEEIRKYKNVVYKEFDFTSYPNFVSKYVDGKLGAYAWKPIIINEESNNLDGNILWIDSACLLKKKPIKIKTFLTYSKLFITFSSNTIEDWTHPMSIKHLNFPTKYLRKRNFMAGIVGFNSQNNLVKKLISEWKKYSLIEDCISPPGSNRKNHRQDQSIFSMLLYIHKLDKYKLRDYKNSELIIGQTFNKIYLQDIKKNEKKYYMYEMFDDNLINETTNSYERSDILLLFDIEKFNREKYKGYEKKKIVIVLESIDDLSDEMEKENSFIDLFLFLSNRKTEALNINFLSTDKNSKFFEVKDIKRKLEKVEK